MNLLKSLDKDLNTLTQATKKYSPEILITMGIAGFGMTIVETVKATRKVDKALNNIDIPEDASKKEEVWIKTKALTPIVAPPVILGVSSVGCILGANKIQSARLTSATMAYNLVNNSFKDYKEAVINEIGEKKEQKVRDKVAEKQVKEYPYNESEVLEPVTSTQLFMESLTNQYFRSTKEDILRGIMRFQKALMVEDYMTVSEMFDYLDVDELRHTALTDACGFNSEMGIDVYFSVAKAANGEPCSVLCYRDLPLFDM